MIEMQWEHITATPVIGLHICLGSGCDLTTCSTTVNGFKSVQLYPQAGNIASVGTAHWKSSLNHQRPQ